MAATISHLCMQVSVLALITFPLALAQDENSHFNYNGFSEANLQLNGMLNILSGSQSMLTNSFGGSQLTSHAFYAFPIKFNSSSSQSFSFSTNFVFAIKYPGLFGHGMAFVISPSMDFRNALPYQYLGQFNRSNIGSPGNHLLAVELDTVLDSEFGDIDDNHIGIDVNSLTSIKFAPAAYFSDADGKNIRFKLNNGDPMQVWMDYSSTEKLLNVTLAPITLPQKLSRPLLSTRLDLSRILEGSMYVGLEEGHDHYLLGCSFNKSGPAQNLNISKLPDLCGDHVKSSLLAKSKNNPVLIFVWFGALLVMLMSTTGATYFIRNKKFEELFEDWEKEYGPQRFSYKTLYQATNGFKDRELIGKGGFGKVYKGIIPYSNLEIAVKRVYHDSEQRMKEFVAEIVSLGKLRH